MHFGVPKMCCKIFLMKGDNRLETDDMTALTYGESEKVSNFAALHPFVDFVIFGSATSSLWPQFFIFIK